MIQHDKNTAACLLALIIKQYCGSLPGCDIKAKDGGFGLALPLLQFNRCLNELSLQVKQFNTKTMVFLEAIP